MWGCALGPFEASALMATSPRKEERRKKPHDEQGDNPGQVRGLDGVLYKL